MVAFHADTAAYKGLCSAVPYMLRRRCVEKNFYNMKRILKKVLNDRFPPFDFNIVVWLSWEK